MESVARSYDDFVPSSEFIKGEGFDTIVIELPGNYVGVHMKYVMNTVSLILTFLCMDGHRIQEGAPKGSSRPLRQPPHQRGAPGQRKQVAPLPQGIPHPGRLQPERNPCQIREWHIDPHPPKAHL